MYAVDLTGSFAGMFPDRIPVENSAYVSSIPFYKRAFAAIEEPNGRFRSAYGFLFSIQPVANRGASIRVHLPTSEDRMEVATKLADGGEIVRNGGLITVTDRYSVTWSIA